MPDIGTVDDLRLLVGSATFIPALLSFIRNSSSGNLPLDPALFQAILLCMVAGGKHLILHTPEEDVGLVVKLAIWTLSSIFDLPTQKVKIRSRAAPTVRSSGDIAPPRDPNLFLRSLFLHSNCSDDIDHSRPASHSRNRSRKQRASYLHSASFPNDLSMLGNRSLGIDHSDPKVVDKELQKPMPEPVSPPLVIVSPQPRHFTHAHTEPAPLRGGSIRPEFPHALVMSGLDHANMAEQMSLAHALTERLVIIEALKHEAGHNEPRPRGLSSGTHESDPRRGSSALLEDSAFEGTWNVPDDFILIYVCPWDARERPKIHKTLLDRFAMSSTIFVSQHIRQALRALPFTSNPIPRSRLLSLSHSSPPTPSPLQPRPPAPQSRTPPALTRALPGTNHPPHCNSSHPPPPPPPLVPKQLIPREFLLFLQGAAQRAHLSSNLSLYLSDLFSAVRHHPRLDGTFLTARALNDARALARAGRIFGTDPTGGELLRGHHGLELFDDDEGYEEDESQTSFKEYNDVASGSGSVTINIPREKTPSPLPSREGSTTKGHHDQTLADEPPAPDPLETLFVSEADIARIFPRVVTHRLRVRDGPEDEVLASAIFGATFEDTVQDSNAAPGYGWDTRSTVKDVLVEVLAEV